MRCPRCGNENSDDNRYCGMCGVSLVAEPVGSSPAPASSATARAANRLSLPPSAPTPSEPLRSESARPELVRSEPVRAAVFDQTDAPPRSEERENSPSISGPSFLGLNNPQPDSNKPDSNKGSSRKSGSLSINPSSATGSGNLDYLLQDDEEPKRSAAGKYVLILVALVLVGGLGYYRWSHGLAPWSIPREAKPLATEDSTTSDNGSTTTSPAASTPPTQPTDSAASIPAPATTPSANAPTTTPSTAAPAASVSDVPPSSDTPTATRPPASRPSNSPPPTRHPKPAAAVPAPKPAAAISQFDRVAEAQKYLYGRGVAQDCDRGLRLLKPAANESNPKAMIEMGALYSAGLCTPHDLPTAYRWFAHALRQDPSNQAAKDDLLKLWGEMTRPEQQLAIRLSQ